MPVAIQVGGDDGAVPGCTWYVTVPPKVPLPTPRLNAD